MVPLFLCLCCLFSLVSRLSFQIPHFLLAFGISDSNFGFVVSHFGLGLRHCDALIAGLPGSPPPLFRSLNTNFTSEGISTSSCELTRTIPGEDGPSTTHNTRDNSTERDLPHVSPSPRYIKKHSGRAPPEFFLSTIRSLLLSPITEPMTSAHYPSLVAALELALPRIIKMPFLLPVRFCLSLLSEKAHYALPFPFWH